MAAAGFTPISLYYTTTSGAGGIPSAGNLVNGELAINITDGKLYYKDNGGTVQVIATKATGTIGGSTTQVQYNNAGVLAGSSNLTFDGTSLTLGGNPTLSAGTANGVLYLNGSKVATSGSALTFDGTNFAASNQIIAGIGVATANVLARSNVSNGGSGFSQFLFGNASTDTRGFLSYSHASEAILFGTSSAEQMRLTSTGLGIGTSSPATKLEVSDGAITAGASAIVLTGRNSSSYPATGAGYFQLQTNNNDAVNGGISIYTNASGLRLSYTIFETGTGSYHAWNTSGSERMRLDSSGNLGLGVTPSAWEASAAIQVVNGYAYTKYGMSRNTYYDGTNYRYITTAAAANYQQSSGAHVWQTAPSGTAGNAISFTQAMTLDASGNLIVGGTSPVISGAGRGNITINGSSTAIMALSVGGSAKGWVYHDNTNLEINAGSSGAMIMYTAGAERARITSGGDLLVGTTSAPDGTANYGGGFVATTNSRRELYLATSSTSANNLARFYNPNGEVGNIQTNGTATAFNTSSDRRLKENISPADDAGTIVDAIQVVKHDWKAGGHTRYGMIAQDLHKVAPEAVSAGDNGEEIIERWSVDYSKLVPMLIKEVQSLRKRVALLEGN